MKVLHLGKYFPPYRGGMETYLRDLMVVQNHQGLDVSAIVHSTRNSLFSVSEQYHRAGVTLTLVRVAVWFRLVFTPLSPAFPFRLLRLIKQQQPDVLHVHMPNLSAFWILLLPAARKVPVVVQWQSDVVASPHSPGLRFWYRFYRPFEQALLKLCRAVIVSSPPYLASSEPLQRWRHKCQVIPLGLVKTTPVAGSAQSVQTEHGEEFLNVLAVGRLSYYKGFDVLIQAISKIGGVSLTIVGDGEARQTLIEMVNHEHLGEKIQIASELSDEELEKEYQQCDLVCLPSIERTEAFGLVVLEAMRAGKPCLVTDVPGTGMQWIVEAGVTGLVVAAGNSAEITKALSELKENRDTIKRMGSAGQRRFLAQFTLEQLAVDILQLYQSLVQGGANTTSAPR